MSNILTLNGVNAYYGSSHILFGVDLAVEKGRSACILGRNGVGKSTTMKTICGAMNPKNHARTEGSIRFGDKELVGMSPYQIAQAGIAYVPQGRHIFSDLTTKENLLIARKKGPNGEQKWTLERIYELFPRLKERENSMGNKLSGGEQQMLTVARGLMQNPTMIHPPSHDSSAKKASAVSHTLAHFHLVLFFVVKHRNLLLIIQLLVDVIHPEMEELGVLRINDLAILPDKPTDDFFLTDMV